MEISIEQYNKMAERLTELEYKEAEQKANSTSDLISRQAAVDLVTNMEFMNNTAKGILRDRLRKLPSAQPERKKGKWIYVERREPQYDIEGEETWSLLYGCSECGWVHPVIEGFGQYNFCPNCGADMRGEKDGKNE